MKPISWENSWQIETFREILMVVSKLRVCCYIWKIRGMRAFWDKGKGRRPDNQMVASSLIPVNLLMWRSAAQTASSFSPAHAPGSSGTRQAETDALHCFSVAARAIRPWVIPEWVKNSANIDWRSLALEIYGINNRKPVKIVWASQRSTSWYHLTERQEFWEPICIHEELFLLNWSSLHVNKAISLTDCT